MSSRKGVDESGKGGYFYGYHASFGATDCAPVDEVLDAVATACRAYHHTEYWCDPMGCEDEGPSYVDNIESKSQEAAAAFASLTARVEELEGALRCFMAATSDEAGWGKADYMEGFGVYERIGVARNLASLALQGGDAGQEVDRGE